MIVKVFRVLSWCGVVFIRRLSFFFCFRIWVGWGFVGFKQFCGFVFSFLEVGGYYVEIKFRIEDYMRDWFGYFFEFRYLGLRLSDFQFQLVGYV